jgi:hypothetical protein
MAAYIGCDLTVQHVHPSSHVSGTINGVASVSCTGPTSSIVLHYSLIRTSPNPTQWGAGTKTSSFGATYLQNNRGVSCSAGPGNFRGWAQSTITAPPGYTLYGPATYSKYGTITSVACGVSFLAETNGSEGSAETAITFVRSDLAS